ncbi:MAG: M20/M25/M40 family metallo-hydrolase [Planctomycetota bacterium]
MPAAVSSLLFLAWVAGGGFAGGFATIAEADLERDVQALSTPELEGRDSPSLGLERAAVIVEERFSAAGLVAAYADAADSGFRRPFQRSLPEPEPGGCALEIPGDAGAPFVLGRDFVPVTGFKGEAEGEIVFAGYGIQSKTERYDDFAGLVLKGKVVLVIHAEPRHDRKFDGPELSRAASLWDKIDDLADAGAAGVLAVRRPAAATAGPRGKSTATTAVAETALSFRYTWAQWNGVMSDPEPKKRLPVLEVSMACASAVLGADVEALAARIDQGQKPVKGPASKRRVRMQSATRPASVSIDNVVGLLRGSDPVLAEEFVVVGAHYDHVGVDARGRIACGADDNASGVAALLEIAEALATAGPRRSALFCAFAGEEDGLLGSKAFCGDLPVPKAKIVAMINMDMIGRGDAGEVAVLGIPQNPSLEKVIARARKLKPSGLREVVMRQGEELFQRSDHYSFHEIGIPVLFFFEGLPIEENEDYHTWRDTVDKVDTGKMLNTTRLVYNTTWLLTDDDERPPPPQD